MVWVLGFSVQRLGCRVQGSMLGFRVQSSGFRVQNFVFWAGGVVFQGLSCMVIVLGFMFVVTVLRGLGLSHWFRVSDFEYSIHVAEIQTLFPCPICLCWGTSLVRKCPPP